MPKLLLAFRQPQLAMPETLPEIISDRIAEQTAVAIYKSVRSENSDRWERNAQKLPSSKTRRVARNARLRIVIHVVRAVHAVHIVHVVQCVPMS